MTSQPSFTSPLRWGLAFAAGLAVFLLVNITTTLVTFILPESFASTARVLLTAPEVATNQPAGPGVIATQLELMRSELVLSSAATALELGEVWGKRFAGGEHLRNAEVLGLLRERLEIRQVGNTALAEVRAFSESPAEAAQLANQVAESYCAMFPVHAARIVDRAIPAVRPHRPNKPLNIGVGMLVGCVLGGLATMAILLMGRANRVQSAPASS